MRRAMVLLSAVGIGALLVSWPLWHVTTPSACRRGPCDASGALRFGSLALTLDALCALALFVVAALLAGLFVGGVMRFDARERHARRQT
jgi:hypothetical protein